MAALRSLLVAGAAAFSLSLGFSPAQAALQILGPGIDSDSSVANDTSLWSLVSGVQTSTPSGDNGKNAGLRYYVVASGAGGAKSVFSLGELNPAFGGTNKAPYVTVTGGTYALIDPNAGAAGRDIANLTSLRVEAVAALPSGAGGLTKSLNLSGLVTDPGTYTLSTLKSDFAPVTETIGGDVYTGVQLYHFLSPSSSNVTDQIVTFQASDGYEVVLSLAELDPALGGNIANLLPYADTGTDLSTSGLARDLLPLDNKHGRWVSNIDSIDVAIAAVPEPSTWAMMLIGFAGLGFAASRQGRKVKHHTKKWEPVFGKI